MTVASNCWLSPAFRETLAGMTVTLGCSRTTAIEVGPPPAGVAVTTTSSAVVTSPGAMYRPLFTSIVPWDGLMDQLAAPVLRLNCCVSRSVRAAVGGVIGMDFQCEFVTINIHQAAFARNRSNYTTARAP